MSSGHEPADAAPRLSRAPVIVGILVLCGLGAFVTLQSPMPGALASPHGQITSLNFFWGCESCHADGGLTAGCLGCHEEIVAQLDRGEGLHDWLLKRAAAEASTDDGSEAAEAELTCLPCHGEHNGAEFELVSTISWPGGDPEAFDHAHVAFELAGAHDALACIDCHASVADDRLDHLVPAYPDLGRAKTWLGLSQACAGCHDDPHRVEGDASATTERCESCHAQESFAEAPGFDHDEHLPLAGAHDDVECAACHDLPEPSGVDAETGRPIRDRLPFGLVEGAECEACHESPHRAAWPAAENGERCTHCHPASAPTWTEATAAITPELHASTGFPLERPHATVDCVACHAAALPFAERYPDATAADYARAPETCQGCHEDIHAGQFVADGGDARACLECHDRHRFRPPAFAIADHAASFELAGAHLAVPCIGCHANDAAGVRRFAETPSACADCHDSPHRAPLGDDCAGCHPSGSERWSEAEPAMTAEAHASTGFRLAAPHDGVACAGCHDPRASFDVAYPDPATDGYLRHETTCQGCHDDVHGGQFATTHDGCLDCHERDRLDPPAYGLAAHDTWALAGAHRDADCASCHRVEATTGVRRFVGTPTACADCHDDVHAGQFGASVDCASCHGETSESWTIRPFDHAARADWPLIDRHGDADCASCHAEDRGVVVYRATPTACGACHTDVHRGQLAGGPAGRSTTLQTRSGRRRVADCEACHEAAAAWDAPGFDHDRSRFPLDGSHESVACLDCHPSVKTRAGETFIRYRPLGIECRDCHDLR